MTRVEVAVGAILDGSSTRVLVAQRPLDVHQGGLWEFPGGKLEPGEEMEAALARELMEELAIEVTASEPLLRLEYNYPDKAVALDVWLVKGFDGDPRSCEGQPLCWVAIADLHTLNFPQANTPIIQALQQKYGIRT